MELSEASLQPRSEATAAGVTENGPNELSTEAQIAELESSIATLRRRVHPVSEAPKDEETSAKVDPWLETFLEETTQEFEQEEEPKPEQSDEEHAPVPEAIASPDRQSRKARRTMSTTSEAASVLRGALQSGTAAPPQLSDAGALVGAGEDSAAPSTLTRPKAPSVQDEGKGSSPDSTAGPASEACYSDLLEDSEDDDEGEPEPSLNYTKLQGGVADVLKKDTASCIAVSDRFIALGTHAGMIYILDIEGNLVKGFQSHTASVLALDIDRSSEFIGSAGMDGLVSISALSTAEQYVFDFRRPMRSIALEPNFARKSTRAFVCGGMAGSLLHREKSWFGHKETVLHAGEGPIWNVQWKGNLIAWANDRGVRVYDTATKQRITFITPPQPDIRADMYRCSLFWKDAQTLLIAWGDHIKVAKIKEKPAVSTAPSVTRAAQYFAEVEAIYQLDSNISGIVPYGNDFLTLVHATEESSEKDEFRRTTALPPELRIITSEGEEHSNDALSVKNHARYQCNDYHIAPSPDNVAGSGQETFYVLTPTDVVVARLRTRKDHIDWLLEHFLYAKALSEIEDIGSKEASLLGYDASKIGRTYLQHLVEKGRFDRAARAATRILGRDAKAWEDWVFLFVERGEFDAVIPYIPTDDPTLGEIVYDMVLAHYLQTNSDQLLPTIQSWPPHIYSTQAVVRAVEDRLKREPSSPMLLESLAAIFIANRQPGKAVPYFLRLRKPNVFDLIREHNLFNDIRDQALSLVEFDDDICKGSKERGFGASIQLLVDHTHSIPINRVVPQLDPKPKYLHRYLDALFRSDSQSVVEYADQQVKLYAEYEPDKLMHYLRSMSSHYKFEEAYEVCKAKDLVPEMVFLLGRVGDNKRALTLIIERLDDVEKAIEFAKEQGDDELWEDLLKYSETRPTFIRGLLENVGAEIDPLRLIRRIKDGLEIPGLKPALIKILQEFNLQLSLLDDCAAILYHDGLAFSKELKRAHRHGMHDAGNGALPTVFFLCRHVYHLSCLAAENRLPKRLRQALPALPLSVTQAGPRSDALHSVKRKRASRDASFEEQLTYEARLRVILRRGCPSCHHRKANT